MGPFTHSLSYSNGFWSGKVDNGKMDLLTFFCPDLDKPEPKRKKYHEGTKTRRHEIMAASFWCFPFFLFS